jgi:superfamily I DNA/RNA helicase
MPTLEEIMTAESTAGIRSRRELLLAEKRERAAEVARSADLAPRRRARLEHRVEAALSPLIAVGYHLLPNRGWPGSRSARIDLIVVGPSGLFIIDTSIWSDLTIRDGRVLRSNADVTVELAELADLGYATEAVMAEVGLAAGEIHPLVVLSGRSAVTERIGTVEIVGDSEIARYILGRGDRLTPPQVQSILHASEDHFPHRGSDALTEPRHPIGVDFDETDAADSADPADHPNYDTIPLLTNSALSRQLEAVLAAPSIEPWMAFPGADMARVIRRGFSGPMRVRGSVGTGKTSLALHRAAYLARSQPRVVLFTSYISTLPAVQASRMKQLAPDVAGRVEFVGTHAFAKRLLSDRDVRLNLQPAVADAEFELVWRTVGRLGPLGRLDPKSTYWEDEIEHVIKGRGISTFEEYAALGRPGRGQALTAEQRRAVWDLYLAYQNRLDFRGVHDEADMILLAEASLRDSPLDRYGAVIIDEAQDLSATMIRMLHLLVGDRPDGLTLISDSKQSIYPGGYTLSEVGVSVGGRGIVMATNFRNPPPILEFAQAVVAGDDFVDVDDEPIEARVAISAPSDASGEPLIVRFTNRATHDAELPRRIRSMLTEPGTQLGDIGILALTTFGVRAAVTALGKANIPVIELTNYDGRPVDAVKVGTVKRAKGLEFGRVILAQIPSTLLPGADESKRGGSDHGTLQKRELYVAATRARHSVWIGSVP